MCDSGCVYNLDFTMYTEWNFGPTVTWYTTVAFGLYMILCLVKSSDTESSVRPPYVMPIYKEEGDSEQTYFIPQPNNVTYYIGQTATLQCSVENLGEKHVIWRKASEPNPISVGEEIFFSKDNRFNVSISRERREFNLVIQDVRRSDAGVYECQVPAKDKLIRLVLLIVLGAPKRPRPNNGLDADSSILPPYVMPELVLTGKKFVSSGDTIRLVCNMTGVTDVLQDLVWFKDGNLIRPFDSNKITIHKKNSISRRRIDSVLEIKNSKNEDSAMYVCRSGLRVASQQVIVLNEEKPIPGRRATDVAVSGQVCNKQWWTLLLSSVITYIITEHSTIGR